MDFLFEELERFDCSESISCLTVSFGGVDNALSRDFFASGCFSGVLETDASELLLSSVALAFLPNRIGRQWNSSVARLDFLLGEVNEDAVGVSPPELVDEIDIMEALFLCLVNLSGRNSQAPVLHLVVVIYVVLVMLALVVNVLVLTRNPPMGDRSS